MLEVDYFQQEERLPKEVYGDYPFSVETSAFGNCSLGIYAES